MAVLGPAPSIGHPGERPRCVGTDIWVRSSACPAPVVHTRHHRVVQRARQSPTSSAVLPSAAGWTTSTYGQVGLRPRPCQTGWTVSGITSTRPPWRESTVRLSGRRLVQCKPDHLFQGLGPDRRLRPAALAHLGEFRRPSAANRCRHCPHAGWSPQLGGDGQVRHPSAATSNPSLDHLVMARHRGRRRHLQGVALTGRRRHCARDSIRATEFKDNKGLVLCLTDH